MEKNSCNNKVKALYELILADSARYFDLARDLWQHPELGFEEHYAVKRQLPLLRDWGFEVEAPAHGLDTAYRATWGKGEITFAFAAEYDALPGLGHACGHNLIATAALAAANGLRLYLEREQLPGRIVVLGTPAEEGGGGKVLMERDGCLDDVDAVMMAHPSDKNTTDSGCLARELVHVEFFGKAAHASGSPDKAINALDALLLLFNATSCWRQQIPEDARIHGVILEGGKRPNIIPDYTKASFYLRSASDSYLAGMVERFKAIVESACNMTGCSSKVEWSPTGTRARLPNDALNGHYKRSMELLGETVRIPERVGRGSTDFGNFSAKRPGIHPYFAISDVEIAGHTKEMAEAANSDSGRANALRAAAAMAATGLAFITDASFREAAAADFKRRTRKE